jgi:hypothetical protein
VTEPNIPGDPSRPEDAQPAPPPSIWIGLVPITLISVTAVIASVRVWHWWPLG